MSIFDKFLRIRELGIFSIILIVIITASIIDSRFLTIDSWRAVFLAIPLILVMAMGQMMVIICRHVDISIGSILAFAAVTIGFVFIYYPGTSLWMALLITAFVGMVMGLINGVIVNKKVMLDAAKIGFTTATDFADSLVKNMNFSFREAYLSTAKVVNLAEKKNLALNELEHEDLKRIVPKISLDVMKSLDLRNSVNSKKSYGGTSFENIKKMIRKYKKEIK